MLFSLRAAARSLLLGSALALAAPAAAASASGEPPLITFQGSGWGHGIGMSQWGAQGWATGASGTALSGEDIVAHYYPGSSLASAPSSRLRVLLSWPSDGCGAGTIGETLQMQSPTGAVIRAQDGREIMRTAPLQRFSLHADGEHLRLMRRVDASTVVFVPLGGASDVTVTPLDERGTLVLDQKGGRSYRGSLRVMVRASGALRAVNTVDLDAYVRAVVPAEMPASWHIEALKAQTYAARTYAAYKQSRSRPLFDVYDDTKDQCYGGASKERPSTDLAVALTAGRILTYEGAPIQAYFSSSVGGATAPSGCVWGLERAGGGLTCGSSPDYLRGVSDPADLLARTPQGHANPYHAWTRTLTPAQIEAAVAAAGANIGSFRSIDLSNRAASGNVISVRVRGSRGSVELAADGFLRGRLGLPSTMVRVASP